MILGLLREQLRSQRAALGIGAAVIAFAGGLAAFAAAEAGTRSAWDDFRATGTGSNWRYGADVLLTDVGDPSGLNLSEWGTPLSTSELARRLTAVNASGAGAWAQLRGSWVTVSAGAEPATLLDQQVFVQWGQAPWDHVTPTGAGPAPGEVLLAGDTARVLGARVGDSVVLGRDGTHPLTLTVAGLAYDDPSSVGWWSEGLYVNPADLQALTNAADAGPDAWTSNPVTALVMWNHERPAVAGAAFTSEWVAIDGFSVPLHPGTATPWLLAAALAMGAVVMAAASGRAQAQRRVRWIATARALGVRRRHLIAVGAAEAGLYASAGAVGAIGGIATSHVWAHHLLGQHATPPPVGVSVPAIVPVGLAVLVAALAVTTAAVPTVLALRVPPTAALKDTPAIDEAELSRRTSIRPVAWAAAAVWAAMLVSFGIDTNSAIFASVALMLALAVLYIPLLVESCRRLVTRAGARLERSRLAWMMHAGMSITAHPRQSAATATVAAFTMTGVGVLIAGSVADESDAVGYILSRRGGQSLRGLAWTTVTSPVGGALVASLVVIALITVQARALAAPERDVAVALGLDRSSVVRSHALAWSVGPALGSLGGALAGGLIAGTVMVALFTGRAYAGDPRGGFGPLVLGMGLSLAAALAFAIVAAACASLLAMVLDGRPPRGAVREPAYEGAR